MSTATNNNKFYTHVQFQTSIGTFCIELYYKHAPRTCHNIAKLAESGYYNNTIFHRVIKDFMIQGGDPTGTGRGGKSIYGILPDEISPNLKHTGAGVVSMANSGQPNSGGSQFFITLKPTPWLDGKHSIFGRVYSGMGVVQRMGMVRTGEGDKPMEDIKIYRAIPSVGPPTSDEVQMPLKQGQTLLGQ